LRDIYNSEIEFPLDKVYQCPKNKKPLVKGENLRIKSEVQGCFILSYKLLMWGNGEAGRVGEILLTPSYHVRQITYDIKPYLTGTNLYFIVTI
jgi:hypothetical protein